MIKEVKVKPIRLHYYCDKCNQEVKATGFVGMSNPPKYKHICKCGEIYWLDNSYPMVEFR